MTPEQILDTLNQQNLITKFRGETDEYHSTFVRFASYSSVINIVNYMNQSKGLVNRPISFITYDDTSDELFFNTHFYNKVDDVIIWVTNNVERIKWTNVVNNTYVLSFPSNSRIGNMLNTRLPVIDKII
jgi:hypothetical protein